jgi:DNA replication protein DnaC
MELDPKHLKMIDDAFAKLSIERPYERKETFFSLGKPEMLKPVFAECFMRYDKTVREFKWLPEYDKVIDWMADNKGKGLFMFGDCGRGKSSIILGVLKPVFLALGTHLPGYHSGELSEKTIESDEFNYRKYRKWKIAYIDELGTEPRVNNYGERFEPFNEIINVAEQNLNILIMSSNLTAELFLERYGNRSMDRINRLCKIIEFKGESLRH